MYKNCSNEQEQFSGTEKYISKFNFHCINKPIIYFQVFIICI